MSAAASPIKRIIKPRERREVAPKLVFNATEKFGKTTLAAYAPSPLILMARGETGYDTLLSASSVPQVPAEIVETWPDLLGWIDSLIANPQGIQTLALDAITGYESMCQEFICAREFSGDWGEKGFMSFQKGYDLAAREWLNLLSRLEQLNIKHGITIIMLGHVAVGTFKNPAGADYDQYLPSLHKKTWEPTAKWADAILFGNFFSDVKQGKGAARGKVTHTNTRIIYTQREGAVIAGNRYGMPSRLVLDENPANNWPTVWDAITGKAQAASAETEATETETAA